MLSQRTTGVPSSAASVVIVPESQTSSRAIVQQVVDQARRRPQPVRLQVCRQRQLGGDEDAAVLLQLADRVPLGRQVEAGVADVVGRVPAHEPQYSVRVVLADAGQVQH